MKKVHKMIYDTRRNGHCCSFMWDRKEQQERTEIGKGEIAKIMEKGKIQWEKD
jgi:hypothetical protein